MVSMETPSQPMGYTCISSGYCINGLGDSQLCTKLNLVHNCVLIVLN